MTNSDKQQKDWYIIDLKGRILGRSATKIVEILLGKHKPTYSKNLDSGDFVIAINAKSIKFSGNKFNQKRYHKHTGYIGNLKTTTLKELFEKSPKDVIKKSVKGMLPKNKLRDKMFKRFKAYDTESHPHKNIKPIAL